MTTAQQLEGASLLSWRRRQLQRGGRRVDFDWLLDLAGGLSWSSLQRLLVEPQRTVQLKVSLKDLEQIWGHHLDQAIPLQHLVGRCPWRDLELAVSAAALIPRQETEVLVDLALETIAGMSIERWADLGTGSGAIAVALSRAMPATPGHAVDLSPNALALARTNLEALAPEGEWHLHQGRWWEPLEPWWGHIDLVVCNPPYIPSHLILNLDPVVRDHEPHLALAGGIDGLQAIREVVAGACRALAPGGWILIEHHHDQSAPALNLLKQAGLSSIRAARDLEGVNRFALARRSLSPCS
ncbi:protein-(glutamine-N5) methyltransferase, release factor-specific [Synechococcus sp. WH 8103]|nr:protein-(glutamine-N5) methyltransferase, release factor-specific [Synechococcus sp. WH 8103]